MSENKVVAVRLWREEKPGRTGTAVRYPASGEADEHKQLHSPACLSESALAGLGSPEAITVTIEAA